MDVTRLWDGPLMWTRLLVAGRTLLAHGHVVRQGRYTSLARAFDLDTLQPLGAAFTTEDVACLAELPGRWSAPVLIDALHGTLAVRDPATGSVLEEVQLAQPSKTGPLGLVAGVVGGSPLAFLLDEDPWNEYEWWAVDLDTGERVPRLGDDCHSYALVREELALAGDYLVVPMQEVGMDDFLMAEVEFPTQNVYRLADGERIARMDCDGRQEVVAAVVGGRSLMAVGEKVYALPGLETVADLGSPSRLVPRALTEWRGLPVLVLTEEESGYFPDGAPFRLFHRLLDSPDRSTVEMRGTVSGRLHEVTAVGDRVVVATSEGVYALRMDP